VQEWHGSRKTSSGRIGPGTRQNKEPRKDGKRLWKGQEFNNGLREGLKQQPRSKIRVKDSGTRRQLRLGNKKTFRLHITKQEDGSSVMLLKMQNWRRRSPFRVEIQDVVIVGESAPFKKEEALNWGFCVKGAGNVGAPATP
jgi:hypothetical protein